jgi:hypothetical protein
MKLYTTMIAAFFGLLMMAMPTVASAEMVRWYPRPMRPVVVQPVYAPAPVIAPSPVFASAPFTPVEYYRPWACANPYFRHHHRWMCR